MATPAVSDGVLYIRGMKNVFAIAAEGAATSRRGTAKADPGVGSR